MARVLIVEDSPTQAAEIRFLLEDAGFEIEQAGDGLEALEASRRTPPELIVTDLQMPGMDGLALVEAVKKEFPSVPVVLITAHGSEEIAARALRCGAASYVPKRDLGRDLADVVHQILAMTAPDPEHGRILQSLEETRFRFVLSNDDALIAPLIRRLEEVVLAMGVCDRAELIRLAVALREAVLNAMEHGNLELDSELRQDDERIYYQLGKERREQSPYRERRVRMDVAVTHDEAAFTVRDEGPGFDPTTLPDPTDPANLLRIGGRGVMLIRTLMDEVRYNATGNEIHLVKRRPVPATCV
jgi:CheY-like chemotaxis protein